MPWLSRRTDATQFLAAKIAHFDSGAFFEVSVFGSYRRRLCHTKWRLRPTVARLWFSAAGWLGTWDLISGKFLYLSANRADWNRLAGITPRWWFCHVP